MQKAKNKCNLELIAAYLQRTKNLVSPWSGFVSERQCSKVTEAALKAIRWFLVCSTEQDITMKTAVIDMYQEIPALKGTKISESDLIQKTIDVWQPDFDIPLQVSDAKEIIARWTGLLNIVGQSV